MIDEKTTQASNPAETERDLLSSLRKRAPIESLLTSTRSKGSSFSSQEPRRPRFSFFHSSQCQRADQSTVAGINRHTRAQHPHHSSEKQTSPGCPAPNPQLFETVNSGSQKLNVVNVGRVLKHHRNDVNTLFHSFVFTEAGKTDLEISFDFIGLLLRLVPCGASLCSGERGSKGDRRRCQHCRSRKTTKPSSRFRRLCGYLC